MAASEENFTKKEDKDSGVYFPTPDFDNLGHNTESEKIPSALDKDKEYEFQGTPELLSAPSVSPNVPDCESDALTYNPPSLVYEDIYEACVQHVKKHCCDSSRLLKQMTLSRIKHDCAFQYILENFYERRESGMTSIPYVDQHNPETTKMSFQFGAGSQPTTQPMSNFSFNTQQQPQNKGFGFGATPTPASGGFSFGGTPTTNASTGFTFGTPASSSGTGFAFGTQNAAASVANTGFSFGAPTATTSSSGFTFGAPAASSVQQPSNTGFAFGQTAATTTSGFSFGQTPTTTASSSFAFGNAAPSTTSGFSFGATNNPQNSGLTFGAPASTGFAFGATPTATTTSGFAFGASAPTPAPIATTAASGFAGFGTTAPTTTTTTAAMGGFNFGTPAATTASTGFSFGNTQSNPTFSNFGAPATTATTAFGNMAPASNTSAPSTGFTFGQPTTTATVSPFGVSASTTSAPAPFQLTQNTATSSAGFNFGPTATSSSQMGFGLTTPSATVSTGFGVPSTTVTATAFSTPNQPQASVAPAFGVTSQPSATPGFQFGMPTATSVASSTPSTSLSQIPKPPTTSAESSGIQFQMPTSSTGGITFGVNTASAAVTSASATAGFTLANLISSTPSSVSSIFDASKSAQTSLPSMLSTQASSALTTTVSSSATPSFSFPAISTAAGVTPTPPLTSPKKKRNASSTTSAFVFGTAAPLTTVSSVSSSLPSAVLNTTTTVTSSIASTTTINFKQLEEVINKWKFELEEQEKVFLNQATQVNAWDRLLITNGEKITVLNDAVERVKLDQQRLDLELEFILAQQSELKDLLLPLEKSIESTPNIHVQQHADLEREHTYHLAENIDAQLKRMAEDIREIIEHVNTANKTQDDNDPVQQIAKILNAHMDALQWVDQNTVALQKKLEGVSKLYDNQKRENEKTFRGTY